LEKALALVAEEKEKRVKAEARAAEEKEKREKAEEKVGVLNKAVADLKGKEKAKTEPSEGTSSHGSAHGARVRWADDFENGDESLVIPAVSDPVQAQGLSDLVQALRDDSRGRDETATEDVRDRLLRDLNEAISFRDDTRSQTRPKNAEALALYDALQRKAEDCVQSAATALRCICVQDLVRDLVAHLLKDEEGLVLIPREKGEKEKRLTTEKCLRNHAGAEIEGGLSAEPDVVVGWNGEEWLIAPVEVKKVKKVKKAKNVTEAKDAEEAEEANKGREKSTLGYCRGQAAVNSFAVLNTCQGINTVRTLLVNGAEYMFLEAKREGPADAEELWSIYTLERTKVLRVESDLGAIVAGLVWWRDGVRSNAALAKRASESQGADQAEDGGMVGQGPPQQGGQGSQGSRASGAENPGGSSAPLPKGTRNAPTRRALQGHDDPPLVEKLNLLGFA
jgi:hypothetical protein